MIAPEHRLVWSFHSLLILQWFPTNTLYFPQSILFLGIKSNPIALSLCLSRLDPFTSLRYLAVPLCDKHLSLSHKLLSLLYLIPFVCYIKAVKSAELINKWLINTYIIRIGSGNFPLPISGFDVLPICSCSILCISWFEVICLHHGASLLSQSLTCALLYFVGAVSLQTTFSRFSYQPDSYVPPTENMTGRSEGRRKRKSSNFWLQWCGSCWQQLMFACGC